MNDTFVKTEHQGFFSRIVNSIVGVLFGLLLVPGSVCLMAWNEYRTVHRARGISEAREVFKEVPSVDQVQPDLDQKLVHLSGQANTEEELKDHQFNFSRKAIRYQRDVEMFQWVEDKDTKTRDKLGGGRETVTTYKYYKQWKPGRVQSESFNQSSGHQNPQATFDSVLNDATKVNVGAYWLSKDLITSIDSWEKVQVDPETQLNNFPENERSQFTLKGDQIFFSKSGGTVDSPVIGDQRISLKVVLPTAVSILASQKGDQLGAYVTSNGESIEILEVGNLSADDLFKILETRNSVLAWILRAVGWGLSSIGFMLIMGPLSTLASVIPLLGRITGGATFFISVVLGAIVSLITIGIAWIMVRPVLAIALFVLAGVGLYFLFRRRGPKQTEEASRFTIE